MYILLGIIVAVVLYFIIKYNGFISLVNRSKEAWADIEVQLKRRYDLIPNLVNSVKGYATHESTAFEKVTAARSAAMGAKSMGDHSKSEAMLGSAITGLFGIAEAYPDLKANTGDQKLTHIMHNRYLTNCYENLSSIEGSLITFGFNFGEYDEHIIESINIAAKHGKKVKDRLWSVYIGVYSDDDKKHIERISSKFSCKVRIYDATTAHVWG
jgi:hypothetical protein